MVGGLTMCGLSLLAATPAPAKSVNADTTTVAMPAPKTPPTSSNPFLFGVAFIARTPFFVLRLVLGCPALKWKNGFPRTLTSGERRANLQLRGHRSRTPNAGPGEHPVSEPCRAQAARPRAR